MTTLKGLEAYGSSGVVFSMAHTAAFQSSLPILKKNYKFSQVLVWGKIQGKDGDFLIAKGIFDSVTDYKFFCCMDGVSWAQMPAPTDEDKALVAKIPLGMPFVGDMSFVYELPVDPVPEGEEPAEDAEPPKVVELVRLAVVVGEVDTACAMCPKPALMKKADACVVPNVTYAGLSYDEANSLASYVFVNQPIDVSPKADPLTASTDFLKPCTEIIPSGALITRFDEASATVTVRSLLYPGFLAFTEVGTNAFGYIYQGTGEKNADTAFMLP